MKYAKKYRVLNNNYQKPNIVCNDKIQNERTAGQHSPTLDIKFWQINQDFTYLLMHNLFSSCIRSFNTQYRTMTKIWVGTFLVRNVQPRQKSLS